MDKNYAYISINGTGKTSEVTEALGISPTNEWNIGDLRQNGTVYTTSHWEYNVPEFEAECMDEALSAVIDYIKSSGLDFSAVPKGFEAFISCAGWHEHKGLGFHLSKDMVISLGRIGLAVDFDLYCHVEQNI